MRTIVRKEVDFYKYSDGMSTYVDTITFEYTSPSGLMKQIRTHKKELREKNPWYRIYEVLD